MVARIPSPVREKVAKEILNRAVDVCWEELSFRERSDLYNEWAQDPDIGGLISDYVGSDRVRLWIKDGPIKEYKRARRGQGAYAKLLPATEQMDQRINDVILGKGWSLKPGSERTKPSRFISENKSGEEVVVVWGSAIELKHVVWHWLTSPASYDCVLVVVAFPQAPITDEVKLQVSRIRSRLDVDVKAVIL